MFISELRRLSDSLFLPSLYHTLKLQLNEKQSFETLYDFVSLQLKNEWVRKRLDPLLSLFHQSILNFYLQPNADFLYSLKVSLLVTPCAFALGDSRFLPEDDLIRQISALLSDFPPDCRTDFLKETLTASMMAHRCPTEGAPLTLLSQLTRLFFDLSQALFIPQTQTPLHHPPEVSWFQLQLSQPRSPYPKPLLEAFYRKARKYHR